MLTMTFLGLETRNDLPKVSYVTALDYFVAITFSFIFATIVQFAIVHYYTKVGSGEYYFAPLSFMHIQDSSNVRSDRPQELLSSTSNDDSSLVDKRCVCDPMTMRLPFAESSLFSPTAEFLSPPQEFDEVLASATNALGEMSQAAGDENDGDDASEDFETEDELETGYDFDYGMGVIESMPCPVHVSDRT